MGRAGNTSAELPVVPVTEDPRLLALDDAGLENLVKLGELNFRQATDIADARDARERDMSARRGAFKVAVESENDALKQLQEQIQREMSDLLEGIVGAVGKDAYLCKHLFDEIHALLGTKIQPRIPGLSEPKREEAQLWVAGAFSALALFADLFVAGQDAEAVAAVKAINCYPNWLP